MGAERRKYPRYRFANKTGLVSFMLDCHKVYILDVSENGLCFEFAHKQAIECIRGDKVRVMMIDNESDVVLNAVMEVKHVEDDAMVVGCQLNSRNPAMEKIVKRLELLRKKSSSHNA